MTDPFSKLQWLKDAPRLGLTASQWCALIEAFGRTDASGRNARLSAEALSAVAGISDRGARQALGDLVARGILIRTSRGGRSRDGRQWASTYALGQLSTGSALPVDSRPAPVEAHRATSTGSTLPVESRSTGSTVPVEHDPSADGVKPRSTGSTVPVVGDPRPGVSGYQPANPRYQPEAHFLPSDQLPSDPSSYVSNAGARGERRRKDSQTEEPASRHLQAVDPANHIPAGSGSSRPADVAAQGPSIAVPNDGPDLPPHRRFDDPNGGVRLQLNPDRLTPDQTAAWSALIGGFEPAERALSYLTDTDLDHLLDRFTRSRRKQNNDTFVRFVVGEFDGEWWSAGRPTGAPFVELVDKLLPPKRRPTPPTPKEPA